MGEEQLGQGLETIMVTQPFLCLAVHIPKQSILITMRHCFLFLFFSTLTTMTQAQSPHVLNPAFHEELSKLLSFSVKTMDVDQLKALLPEVVLLDAREPKEYKVSHIPGALNIGYNHPDFTVLNGVPKDATIVVYCSVGYRSEKIGEKLEGLGFKNVFNLYGSIFEWANRGYTLQNSQGEPTDSLHTFNDTWSKWVDNPGVKKTW